MIFHSHSVDSKDRAVSTDGSVCSRKTAEPCRCPQTESPGAAFPRIVCVGGSLPYRVSVPRAGATVAAFVDEHAAREFREWVARKGEPLKLQNLSR